MFLALLLILPAGCGYFGYYARSTHLHQTFEYLPSLSVLNRLAPENSLVIRGTITARQRQEPLLLVAVSSQYQENEKVAVVQVPQDLTYTVFVPPGSYDLFVFADIDRNRDFEWNEMIGTAHVTVEKQGSRVVVDGPEIRVDFDHPGTVSFRLSETVRPTGYAYGSLDDDFFDPRYGNMGLYNPSELIAHTQGFFFGLADYDPDRTMVLFVHGIAGTPRDWKYVVAGLDRSRFQPFFYYYPSGLPLDKLGTLLAQHIRSLDRTGMHGRHALVLVAHSMGGLVALSAINKLAADGLPPLVKLYCSFSTPYAGDESARKGIEIAPVVVPVWRDIATGSQFLTELHSRPFPKQLPYYLYFSYLDTSKFKLGESSDGSVSLRSQLLPSMQAAATRVIGINDTHEGILNNADARASLFALLDSIAPMAVKPTEN